MIQTTEPLVSVCMPAYNVGRTLRLALESVLSQTYQRLEVVLVDDGSTDDTQEVASSFRDDRIRYIRNKTNLGGYQTMNKAVSLARGDFVAIYHTDDVYEPTIVEKEVDYLRSHPEAGAVFCMDHFIDDEGQVYGETSLPLEFMERKYFVYEDVFPFLLRHKNILLRCSTFKARRGTLETVGPFDAETYDIAADLDMWIRIVRRFPIGILNERLMYYRAGGGQWSSRYNYLRTDPEWHFRIMDRYLTEDGWLERLSTRDLSEYAFHRCDDETFRAINWLLKGDRVAAKRLLQKGFPWSAFWHNPNTRKLRLLVLRALVYCGLYLLPGENLRSLLHRITYRRRFIPCQSQQT
jgi:glycosyltransferase involved in cell wall biosynthesis